MGPIFHEGGPILQIRCLGRSRTIGKLYASYVVAIGTYFFFHNVKRP